MTARTCLTSIPVTGKAGGINIRAFQAVVDVECQLCHTDIITGIYQDTYSTAYRISISEVYDSDKRRCVSAAPGELLTITVTFVDIPMFPAAS